MKNTKKRTMVRARKGASLRWFIMVEEGCGNSDREDEGYVNGPSIGVDNGSRFVSFAG